MNVATKVMREMSKIARFVDLNYQKIISKFKKQKKKVKKMQQHVISMEDFINFKPEIIFASSTHGLEKRIVGRVVYDNFGGGIVKFRIFVETYVPDFDNRKFSFQPVGKEEGYTVLMEAIDEYNNW